MSIVEVDVQVYCSECGDELEELHTLHHALRKKAKNEIVVQPCEKCMKGSYKEGRDKGYSEGEDEGYAKGKNRGWDQGYSEGEKDGYRTGARVERRL